MWLVFLGCFVVVGRCCSLRRLMLVRLLRFARIGWLVGLDRWAMLVVVGLLRWFVFCRCWLVVVWSIVMRIVLG